MELLVLLGLGDERTGAGRGTEDSRGRGGGRWMKVRGKEDEESNLSGTIWVKASPNVEVGVNPPVEVTGPQKPVASHDLRRSMYLRNCYKLPN